MGKHPESNTFSGISSDLLANSQNSNVQTVTQCGGFVVYPVERAKVLNVERARIRASLSSGQTYIDVSAVLISKHFTMLVLPAKDNSNAV